MKTLAEKTLRKAERQTAERFEQREAQKTKRGITYAAHTEGRAFCEALLPALAAFMLSREAPIPPEGLERVIRQLAPEDLAFVALSPLVHQIAIGWKRGDDSAAMKLKLTMGRVLHDKLLMRQLLKENRGTYGRIMKGRPIIGTVRSGENITSIAVVHDSFGCLAPQARELHRIIRTQFAELYGQDVLADLAAGSSETIPAKGSLDPSGVLHSEYAFA